VKIGGTCEVRDVLGKVRELSRVTPRSRTLDEKVEWELFREENKIKFTELLRGTKPDELSLRSIKGEAIRRHPGVKMIRERLNTPDQKQLR